MVKPGVISCYALPVWVSSNPGNVVPIAQLTLWHHRYDKYNAKTGHNMHTGGTYEVNRKYNIYNPKYGVLGKNIFGINITLLHA